MKKARTLILLRHAKSRHGTGETDHDRPLAPRGKKDMTRIGAYLHEHALVPELVLCSTAVRARQTVTLLAENTGLDSDRIVFIPDLYAASAEGILNTLETAPADVTCLMAVAHNPGMEDLARLLAGDVFPHDKLPTGTAACFETTADNWGRIAPENTVLKDFVRTKKKKKTKKKTS